MAVPTSFPPVVCVVGFHHHRGPEIESWYGVPPGSDPATENDWNFLPFMALADGAHASTEDFSYFTLRRKINAPSVIEHPSPEAPLPSISSAKNSDLSNPATEGDLTLTSETGVLTPDPTSRATSPRPVKVPTASSVFGMSCARQLDARELVRRPDDVTRSTVQKSVVVLTAKPARFAGWREKLGAVTRAWFAQRDFEDTEILKHFQESLVDSENEAEDEKDHFLGASLRQFIYNYRYQALVLFKCCLLQHKVLFFGAKTEQLCMLQFALISLIPGLIRHLEDCADPELDSYESNLSQPTSLRSSDRSSLLAYMGLPLQIFGKGSFFGPYTPLQQLDLLTDTATSSYLIGSTNSLLLQQRHDGPDVVVDVDEYTISINSPALRNALALSSADRRWIDSIHQIVAATWDPLNPTQPTDHAYLGSEDFIKYQFEEYLLNLLSATKFQAYFHTTPHRRRDLSAFEGVDNDRTSDFGDAWMDAWKLTPNFALWNKHTDSHLFDIFDPKHPTAGGMTIDDINRRFTQQIQDLHLDERLAPAREALNKHLATGQKKVSTAFNTLWIEIEARREAQRSRWVTSRSTSPAPPASAPSAVPTEKVFSSASGGPYFDSAALKARAPDLAQAQAAVGAAGKSAGAYLSSWGSWANERRKGWGSTKSTMDLRAGAQAPPASTPTTNASEKAATRPARSPALRTAEPLGMGAENLRTAGGPAEQQDWESGGVMFDGETDRGLPSPRSPRSPRKMLSKRFSVAGRPKEKVIDGIGRLDA